MKDKLVFWLLTGGVAFIFAAGVAAATWGRQYLEFPKVWAQEKAAIEQRFKREAREERLQTMLMRDMLAQQLYTACRQEEHEPPVCQAQQDSLRRVWFVQDSVALVQDTASTG
jgi:hypothetical protein